MYCIVPINISIYISKKSLIVPAQRRPIMLVPAMEVLTTGITSANSASYVLQSFAFHRKYAYTHKYIIYKELVQVIPNVNLNYISPLNIFNLKQILTNPH